MFVDILLAALPVPRVRAMSFYTFLSIQFCHIKCIQCLSLRAGDSAHAASTPIVCRFVRFLF